CLIGRAPVRIIFFVRNDLRRTVQFQAGRAEMIAQLVANQRFRRTIAARRSSLDQGDALSIVHYAQRRAFEGDLAASSSKLTVEFEVANIILGMFWRAVLPFGDLAPALAAAVVDVVRCL